MGTNDIKTLIGRFLSNDISGKDLVSLSKWAAESSTGLSCP